MTPDEHPLYGLWRERDPGPELFVPSQPGAVLSPAEARERIAAGTLGDGMDHYPAQLREAYLRGQAGPLTSLLASLSNLARVVLPGRGGHRRPLPPAHLTRRGRWVRAVAVLLLCCAWLALMVALGKVGDARRCAALQHTQPGSATTRLYCS